MFRHSLTCHTLIRHALVRLALTSCAALATAGALAAGPSTAASQPTANLKLRDTRWALETLEGTPAGDAGRQAHLVLASTSQHLRGHAGCNRLSGRYTQRGTQLALKPLATTRTACPPAQLELETRLLQALAATDSYRIEGHVLSLLQGDAVKATFRAPEKR